MCIVGDNIGWLCTQQKGIFIERVSVMTVVSGLV